MRRLPDSSYRPQLDNGVALIEIVMAMTLFVTVMAVITSATMAMVDNMRQVDGVSLATDQNRLVFNRLDKQVRYALAISDPGYVIAQDAWYVELTFDDPKKDTSAGPTFKQQVCAQWRLAGGKLQTRDWRLNPAGLLAGVASDWTTIGTGFTNGVSEPAFVSPPVSSTIHQHQQLTVDLRVKRSSRPLGQAHLRSTFFARNTTPGTTRAVCDQVARN